MLVCVRLSGLGMVNVMKQSEGEAKSLKCTSTDHAFRRERKKQIAFLALFRLSLGSFFHR